jgi:N,N'-diacetylchitobiose phosphorylase
VRALAELGRSERAAALLEMLSPVTHGASSEALAVYRAEPYVIAADVYGVAPHVGRAGWTWYTGSAGWMFRIALESILGLSIVRGERIELCPCIPASWPGFRLRYRLPDRRTAYDISVQRAGDLSGSTIATIDGEPAEIAERAVLVPLRLDGREHRVMITLGGDVGPRYSSREEQLAGERA